MILSNKNGVVLVVLVQSKAAKTEFVGIHGDALKFHVAASPIGGAANAELCRYLPKLFAILPRTVSVCSVQQVAGKG